MGSGSGWRWENLWGREFTGYEMNIWDVSNKSNEDGNDAYSFPLGDMCATGEDPCVTAGR